MRRWGALIAVLTLAGNGLGLVRDLVIAALFGAGAESDAFLAAWSVPETASPLLLEGLLALIGIPYLTRAVLRGRAPEAVAATFWPVIAALCVAAIGVALASPALVALTVPGIADPELAASCMRLAAPTVPLLGAAGYLAALLRAHDHQVRPAGVYLAYNVGIILTMIAGAHTFGVRAAAAGLSVGAAAMCLLLAPQAVRAVGLPTWRTTRLRQWLPAAGLAGPLLCYLLTRQGQTFVERFFASSLQAGSISELNYAQKVGQVPGTVAVAIALAGFAAIARDAADGAPGAAAGAVVRGMRAVLALVVPSTAGLSVLAPLVVPVLFERGNFDAAASAGTAAALRVYVLGLPGQALVSVLVIAAAALRISPWLAARSAGIGLVVTAVAAAALAGPFGTPGIAAADATGIWVAALLLLRGVWRAFDTQHPGGTADAVLRTTGASIAAAGVGAASLALPIDPDPVHLAVAGLLVVAAGLGAAYLLRADDVLAMLRRGRAAQAPGGGPGQPMPTSQEGI